MSTCDDRYQHQSFHVRCYRWWRYMAPYKLYASFVIVRWVCMGAKPLVFEDDGIPPTPRGETMRILWRCASAKGEMKAQHYYTMEELFDKI